MHLEVRMSKLTTESINRNLKMIKTYLMDNFVQNDFIENHKPEVLNLLDLRSPHTCTQGVGVGEGVVGGGAPHVPLQKASKNWIIKTQ